MLIVGDAPDLEDALRARGYAVSATPVPDTLGPLMTELQGVSAVCWLGDARLLGSFAAKLVDTHVRGFACRAEHAGLAERFAATYRMPTAVIEGGRPDDAVRAVESIIG